MLGKSSSVWLIRSMSQGQRGANEQKSFKDFIMYSQDNKQGISTQDLHYILTIHYVCECNT